MCVCVCAMLFIEKSLAVFPAVAQILPMPSTPELGARSIYLVGRIFSIFLSHFMFLCGEGGFPFTDVG